MPATKIVVLLINCPDQKGVVATVSNFLFENGANIIDSQQHSTGLDQEFFMRIEFDASNFKLSPEELEKDFASISQKFSMKHSFCDQSKKKRMAILVSKYDHCLYDLLLRQKYGELNVEIPLIISNHKDLEHVANNFGIEFHHVPSGTKQKMVEHVKEVSDWDAKKAAEQKILSILKDAEVDFVALARYMQIISGDFVKEYPMKIINVHHGFLPAFKGAKPYHQAYEKGVKIIGATSHYVTEDLDVGPIIEQDVIRVNHKDEVDEYLAKGRDIEKLVFARAIKAHVEDKTIVFQNRTLVFD